MDRRTSSLMFDEARRLTDEGAQVTPVRPRGKEPVLSDWPTRILSPEELPEHFAGQNNLGLVLGHGGLVDLDLDCPEAVEIGRLVMPSTDRRFGRFGAPNSHLIYRCDPLPPYATFKDPDPGQGRRSILEVRSGNHQTIVPPSIHPSGEEIKYDVRGEPAAVPGSCITHAAALTAALVLIARSWPSEGARHDAALHLAGLLARLGRDEESAGAIVEVVARLGGDDDVKDRVRAAHDTVRNYREGTSITGCGQLIEALAASPARKTQIETLLSHWREAREHEPVDNSTGQARGGGPGHRAAVLRRIADDLVPFRTPEGEFFVRAQVGARREIMPIVPHGRDSDLMLYLSHRYEQETGRSPTSVALQQTLTGVHARARFEGEIVPVFTRLGVLNGKLYLDLGPPDLMAVEIDAEGWRIVDNPPVYFHRPRGLFPLPVPEEGGSLDDLWNLIPCSENDQYLIGAWLLYTLNPTGPYPVLAIHGEHGAAKSTTTRLLRSIVDPSETPVRTPPKDVRDLAVAARNGWIMAYDNLSCMQRWLSDALCQLSTGGGFATRKLYADHDEEIFYAKRPIVFNGIVEVASRGDLLDRVLVVTLPPITGEERRRERDITEEFGQIHPGVLGALLRGASRAMRDTGSVELSTLPRMADFAFWTCAASPALGWDPDCFLAAYEENRADAVGIELEASPVATALPVLLERRCGVWEGTATELLADLKETGGDQIAEESGWPKDAARLSGTLKRLAPALRARGIVVEFASSRATGSRKLTIRRSARQ